MSYELMSFVLTHILNKDSWEVNEKGIKYFNITVPSVVAFSNVEVRDNLTLTLSECNPESHSFEADYMKKYNLKSENFIGVLMQDPIATTAAGRMKKNWLFTITDRWGGSIQTPRSKPKTDGLPYRHEHSRYVSMENGVLFVQRKHIQCPEWYQGNEWTVEKAK